jgi:UrcA family protein
LARTEQVPAPCRKTETFDPMEKIMSAKIVLSTTLPVLAILAAGAPAMAADATGNSTVVRYSDLNLASDDGQATLNRRIAQAAKSVCWQADGPTLTEHQDYAACRSTALASAQPTLNAVIASARSDHRYAMNGSAIAMLAR